MQLQLPQYHFQATPVQPRPNIWPGILQGIAALAKDAEDLTPEAREKKKLESMELRYKTGVFAKQLENMQHGGEVDADGLPMYKPDGTPYSYAEKQEMKARAQEMKVRDEQLKRLRKLNEPPASNDDVNAHYFDTSSDISSRIPQFIPDTAPEDYHSAIPNDEEAQVA